MLNKCIDTNVDTHMALRQIRSTSLRQMLPCPATLLFNCPIRGIMPIHSRPSINTNNDDDYYETLVARQAKAHKNYDTFRNYNSITIVSIRAVQRGLMAQ